MFQQPLNISHIGSNLWDTKLIVINVTLLHTIAHGIVHSRTDIGVHVQTQIKPLGNCSNFLPEIQTNGHRYCAMI